jgi:serine acetyltransferase/glycosyltransferase involved in cell wall biosynthesis
LSVVIATYNRPDSILALLGDLGGQQGLAPGAFEVIVVDDGSPQSVRERLACVPVPYPLRVIEQANAGPAAARHRGIEAARGPIIVIVDDDMRVPPGFLAAHRAAHAAGAELVQGAILPADGPMPLFERWHAAQIAAFAQEVTAGTLEHRGDHTTTGNVSLRRARYFDIGGFDPGLQHSEDRDLGIRLEAAGARIQFVPAATSVHYSDRTSLAGWMQRSFKYGVNDTLIARKHADDARLDTWAFLSDVNPVSRPFLILAVLAPSPAAVLAHVAMRTALIVDRLGLRRLGLAGTTFAYGLQYFRGVRAAEGSLRSAGRSFARYLGNRSRARLRAGRGAPLAAWLAFRDAVRTDHAVMTAGRTKYLGESSSRSWLVDHVTMIGAQLVFAIRVMRLLRDCGMRTLARVASRLIRHVYCAEIHWDAEIAPGMSIIHGNGLVISHAARLGEGCVLFHNVTLGVAMDPETGRIGAPVLGRNVHVGPGATIIGPIEVGEGSKVMAGAVLYRSVPPNSLVRPAPVEITRRGRTRPLDRGAAGL